MFITHLIQQSCVKSSSGALGGDSSREGPEAGAAARAGGGPGMFSAACMYHMRTRPCYSKVDLDHIKICLLNFPLKKYNRYTREDTKWNHVKMFD